MIARLTSSDDYENLLNALFHINIEKCILFMLTIRSISWLISAFVEGSIMALNWIEPMESSKITSFPMGCRNFQTTFFQNTVFHCFLLSSCIEPLRMRHMSYFTFQNGPPWAEGLLERIDSWRANAAMNDDLTMMEFWRDLPG